ncbi:MAG: HPr family phosphocarrier protein [Planctomycetota bacterium]|jgi:phosphocarrier protein
MELSKTVKLINQYGLHARPATVFVETSNRFICDILVIKEGVEVNGKSIMGIMMLGAECGSTLEIKTIGEDAEEAVNTLAELVESGFGEG